MTEQYFYHNPEAVARFDAMMKRHQLGVPLNQIPSERLSFFRVVFLKDDAQTQRFEFSKRLSVGEMKQEVSGDEPVVLVLHGEELSNDLSLSKVPDSTVIYVKRELTLKTL